MTPITKTIGLVAAPLTPMKIDGSIHYAKIEEQADLFYRNRVAGVFICGTTGESLSLTIDERKQIAETWRDAIDPSLRCIVHIGHECLLTSKELAVHAESIGVDAVAAFSPVFYKPVTLEALTAWFQDLAACTSLPIYYYNIPSMTGVSFPIRNFLEAMNHLDNLAGIKFTHENLLDFGQCLDFQDGTYDVLFGRDEMLLSGLALGARGAVGSFYNFAAPLFNGIIDSFNSGDMAKAQIQQGKARELVQLYFKYGGSISTAKAMMKIAAIDCGPARLPIMNISPEQVAALDIELAKIGFFEYCSK